MERFDDLVGESSTPVCSGSVCRAREPRTVHCSVPRETPPNASSTLRFVYLPSPNTAWSEPSSAQAWCQSFSVQLTSGVPTDANVSAVWWSNVSSAGTSGPIDGSMGRQSCRPGPYDAAVADDLSELTARFRDWLAARVGASVELGALEAPTLGGLSNDTFLVEADWGDGARGLVLRLAPGGRPLFPDQDLTRQVAVMRALHDGSEVPVPEVLWEEPDAEVLGRPFYVMARVEGRIPPDNPGHHFEGWVKELKPQQQRGLYDKSIDMMALINRVDVERAGLGFLDRPEHGDGPIAQEIGYWRRYLDWAADGEELPFVEGPFAWCVEHRPESNDRSLVWGDARLGNLVYDDDLAPVCVLDWEMAVLGPAELDLGWYLFLDRTALMFTDPLPGFPEREGTIARYGSRLGRGVRDVDWYEAWGGVRAACIQVRLGLILYEMGVYPDLAYRGKNPVTRALRELTSS